MQTLTIFFNAISFFYPVCRGFTIPPTVSCAVQCDPGSPLCLPNVECKSHRPTELILPYLSRFPNHLFHLTDYTAAEITGTKRNPHGCAITVTVIVMSHHCCQCSALHNSGQFLYEHKHEAVIVSYSVQRLHSRFIKQPSH